MEPQEYIDKIAERRGSVGEFHKVMAKHDFPALVATDDLTRATVLAERSIDTRTKQLLFIVSLAALKGDPEDLAMHIRAGLGFGISAQEILEALEILIPLGGVILFKEGFEVWREVTGADGLEASASVGERAAHSH